MLRLGSVGSLLASGWTQLNLLGYDVNIARGAQSSPLRLVSEDYSSQHAVGEPLRAASLEGQRLGLGSVDGKCSQACQL